MTQATGARTARRFAIGIPLLMAAVSIVSAIVANRAAIWSATAGDLDAQAVQEVLEAQQLEDDLSASVDSDSRLVGRYDAAWKRSSQLRDQAAAIRADDPTTAAGLDLAAQGEFGVDVALWQFFRVAWPRFDAEGGLIFDAEGARTALRAGDARLAELDRSDAATRAAEARGRTTSLVAVAAVFVASLFALTVAEVTSGRRRLVALAAGMVLASVAVVLTVVADLSSGVLVVGSALLALPIIAMLLGGPPLVRRVRTARRARMRGASAAPRADADMADASAVIDMAGTPAGTIPKAAPGGGPSSDTPLAGTPQVPAEGAGAGVTSSSLFAGVIGVLLAGATLLGAVVGYFQGAASDAGETAARDARDQALLALTEHQRSNQWATSQVEQWTEVLEERARAVAARQAAAYWAAHGDPARSALATAEADQRSAVAERAAMLTELTADHPDGPQADPDFPLRFFAAQREQTARRIALQDIANEANAHYGAVSAGHVAVLATIAIAAYLLGLSLVLDDRRSQRLFGVVGAGLLLVSGIWAVRNELGAPARPDTQEREAIAAAYARGSVTATTARTSAQWKAAEAGYRAALALHPTLSRAWAGLAGVVFMAGSPQIGSGFTSVSSIDAVREAALALETARALGWENLSTLGDGGFYETLLALDAPAGGHAAKAVELTARARDLAPELPVVRYNHGAALLVAGRIDEAREAYRQGVEVSMAKDADGQPLFSDAQRWQVAAGALTDLHLVEASLGADLVVGPAIDEFRQLVVAGLSDPVTNIDPATQPVVSELRIQSSASELWWEARIEGYEPERDVMSVVWSYEDPVIPGRHVLDTHSGPLRLGSVTDAGSFYIDGEAPNYWSGRSYLIGSTPHRCVPDGSYQVSLYVNGRLAADPVTRDIDQPNLVAVSRRDMGLLFCRPADWVEDGQEDGMRASFRSPDGTLGLMVVRAFRPSVEDGDTPQSLQVMGELVADLPGAPEAVSAEPVENYLMGLSDSYAQWYDTASTRVKVLAGVDGLGTVFAVVIRGPADWVDSDIPDGILGSFATQ